MFLLTQMAIEEQYGNNANGSGTHVFDIPALTRSGGTAKIRKTKYLAQTTDLAHLRSLPYVYIHINQNMKPISAELNITSLNIIRDFQPPSKLKLVQYLST